MLNMLNVIGGLLLLASPVLAVDAEPAADQQPVKVVVRQIQGNDGAEAEIRADVAVVSGADGVTTAADGENGARFRVMVAGDDEDADAPRVFAVARQFNASDPNRGWLGVALDGSSDDAQQGVHILNVVTDSPADVAGIQIDDVVTMINGQPVEDLHDFVGLIGEAGPDATVDLTINRKGDVLTLKPQLTSRPESWNWQVEPDATFDEHVKQRMLRLAPNGQLLELKGIEGLDNLFENDGLSTSITIDDGVKVVEISAERNGEQIEIRREGDGPIVVTRGDVETEYADLAELENGDPEAAKLFNRSGGGKFMMFAPGANAQFGVDDDFKWLSDDVRSQIHIDAEKLHDAAQVLKNDFTFDASAFGKAQRSFRVNPDGQIEVTIRTGGDEVIQVYRDEDDLANRAPDLYDRYADVLDAQIADE